MLEVEDVDEEEVELVVEDLEEDEELELDRLELAEELELEDELELDDTDELEEELEDWVTGDFGEEVSTTYPATAATTITTTTTAASIGLIAFLRVRTARRPP